MSATRTLFVLRHAKSSWEEPDKRDRDRPLTVRGIQNAQRMGQELQSILKDLEQIITSPANRATHTALLVAASVGLPMEIIKLNEKLYEADPSRVDSLVRALPDGLSRVMIVGHNPTFTLFANRFLLDPLDEMPTAGLVMLRFSCPLWSEISSKNLTDSSFHYPKMFHDLP